MLQNRKESMLAIGIIMVAGLLSMNGIINRMIGLGIALGAFAVSEIYTCMHLKKQGENWMKEAILGTGLILILLFLLFQ